LQGKLRWLHPKTRTRTGLSATLISRCACSFAETATDAFAWLCSIIHRTGIVQPDH
jgi:hypothetical protein